MAGWAAHDNGLLEPKLSPRVLWYWDHLGRDELRACLAQSLGEHGDVPGDQRRLPMPEIVGFGVRGQRPAPRRRFVIQELDVWRWWRRQHGGNQAGIIEQAVQDLLRRAGVQRNRTDLQSEQIAIERHARVAGRNGHGGVIEPEEQLVRRLVPGCIAFPGWEIDQLEIVTFRIMEFDCLYPRGARVRGRDGDGVRRNLLDVVVLQDLVSGIHVPHDDGHMLEPLVVAVGWYR